MKFKMKCPGTNNMEFAPNANVDVIGQPISFEDQKVAEVVGYEIINGDLILECETDNPAIMEMFRGGL